MIKMTDIDIFDNDERIVVNKACEGTPLSAFTKQRLLANLTFAHDISTGQDVLNLLDGLIEKVKHVSEEEWESLKVKIPFATYYDAESNVDEVPVNEE